jgi:hypothetical protein
LGSPSIPSVRESEVGADAVLIIQFIGLTGIFPAVPLAEKMAVRFKFK